MLPDQGAARVQELGQLGDRAAQPGAVLRRGVDGDLEDLGSLDDFLRGEDTGFGVEGRNVKSVSDDDGSSAVQPWPRKRFRRQHARQGDVVITSCQIQISQSETSLGCRKHYRVRGQY